MKIPKWICHQKPERGLEIFNKKMPLCSRCFALYLSFIFGFMLDLIFDISANFSSLQLLLITIILVLPMALDGTTQLLKLRESNNFLRVLTGFLAGIILGVAFHYELIWIL